MAKKSMIARDAKRARIAENQAAKRAEVKARIMDKTSSLEDRFAASMELAKLPRNGSKSRIRNRCGLTGRPRGYYRKFNLSRIALRELGSQGMLPGVIKSSW